MISYVFLLLFEATGCNISPLRLLINVKINVLKQMVTKFYLLLNQMKGWFSFKLQLHKNTQQLQKLHQNQVSHMIVQFAHSQ